MTIQSALEQVKESTHPVAKVLHKGEHFKVLVIAFKAGMILKDHQTNLPAKLTLLSGSVLYKETNREVTAKQYDEVEIPVHTIHNVTALEDSLCILSQG